MPLVVPSYTLQDPTLQDIDNFGVSRQSNGAGGSVFVRTASGTLKDENGEPRLSFSVSAQISGSEAAALAALVGESTLAQIISEYGL